jgi:hypothetical protein
MSRARFFTILFLLNLTFIFIKIYQHNLIIKLNYEKQRVENIKHELKREKNDFRVKFFTLRNQEEVARLAQEKLGMQPLKLSQIITFTQTIS